MTASLTTYHGSREADLSVIKTSLDDAFVVFDGLFTSDSRAAAASHGDYLYEIVSPRPLSNFDLNYKIEGAWEAALEIAGGDDALADAILSPDCPATAEVDGWAVQNLRGQLALTLGYTSVEMRDEHGVTWFCLPGCSIRRI